MIIYTPGSSEAWMNGISGIMVVNGGSLTLSGVTINCWGRSGIDVSGSSLRLENVILQNTSPYAVNVKSSSNAALINCTFESALGENDVIDDGTGSVSYEDN